MLSRHTHSAHIVISAFTLYLHHCRCICILLTSLLILYSLSCYHYSYNYHYTLPTSFLVIHHLLTSLTMHSYSTHTGICKYRVDLHLISTLLTLLISLRVRSLLYSYFIDIISYNQQLCQCIYPLLTSVSVHSYSTHIVIWKHRVNHLHCDLHFTHILCSYRHECNYTTLPTSLPLALILYSHRFLQAQGRPPLNLYSTHSAHIVTSTVIYSTHIFISASILCSHP